MPKTEIIPRQKLAPARRRQPDSQKETGDDLAIYVGEPYRVMLRGKRSAAGSTVFF
jgi:hypothetical protein